MRDMYTNLIINDVFQAQNELYKMTYGVKTAQNLFTWCLHERYPVMMEINQS